MKQGDYSYKKTLKLPPYLVNYIFLTMAFNYKILILKDSQLQFYFCVCVMFKLTEQVKSKEMNCSVSRMATG